MKNLSNTLVETLLSHDAGDRANQTTKNFRDGINWLLTHYKDCRDPHMEINDWDEKHVQDGLKNGHLEIWHVDEDGFPTVVSKSKITHLELSGDIKSLDGIDLNKLDTLTLSSNKKFIRLAPAALKAFNNINNSKLTINILTGDTKDNSNVGEIIRALGGKIHHLYVEFGDTGNAEVLQFNPSLQIDNLALSSRCVLKNLPKLKILTFNYANIQTVMNMIGQDFEYNPLNKKIKINGRELSTADKEKLSKFFVGEDGANTIPGTNKNTLFGDNQTAGKLLKFLDSINKTCQDTDPTKDAYGTPLEQNDIVILSNDARKGAYFDIYVDAVGSRIKTTTASQVCPRQCIGFKTIEKLMKDIKNIQ